MKCMTLYRSQTIHEKMAAQHVEARTVLPCTNVSAKTGNKTSFLKTNQTTRNVLNSFVNNTTRAKELHWHSW